MGNQEQGRARTGGDVEEERVGGRGKKERHKIYGIGVKLWNGLEIKLKSCRNVQVFKKCFKEKCVLLMIKLADTTEYKLCERCKTWYGVIQTGLQKL